MSRPDPSLFLSACDVIDHAHPSITALSASLRGADELATVAGCFVHVRDQISHCIDAGRQELTCRASDVLRVGTGFCYAKSHLLVALLRANAIPAGLCYQRLAWSDDDPRFTLHGLAAVHVEPYGWVRVDPRGNKPGVDARFSPPAERLAFAVRPALGEADFPGVWARPWRCVVELLEGYPDVRSALPNLPDVPADLAAGSRL